MSARITVRSPACTCTARRWFDCTCDREETVYDAAGHPWEIEDIGVPTLEFVAYVVALHPAADLIYIRL